MAFIGMNDDFQSRRVGTISRSGSHARWGKVFLSAAALLLVLWSAHWLAPASAADHSAVPAPTASQPVQPAAAPPPLIEQVGIASVDRELGAQSPTGRGIVIGHVEAGDQKGYTPDVKDPAFSGVTMTLMSGASDPFGHAETTSHFIYGPYGLAPGVSQVKLWRTNDWFGSGGLRLGSSEPPTAQNCRLFNHSWIAAPAPFDTMALARVDYLIDHDDVVMVAGVNNGAATSVPTMLAAAYNVIAVGPADRDSSGGYTIALGVGRCKPDIVAPADKTSFSAPIVTAICARLLEEADHLAATFPQARRSAVIKAVLMAGAEKPAGWAPAPGKPLDEHLGAGSARFDHSLAIFRAGPCMPGPLTGPVGWDWHPLGLHTTASYDFTVTKPTGELSIMLVWNRRIAGPRFSGFAGKLYWDDTATLAHFDLALVRIGDHGGGQAVAFSASPIDNVQHIHLKSLAPGHYRFGVRRHDDLDQDWNYALAWRIDTASLAPAAIQPIGPAKR
jgi:hypothetical protein